ncbi:MAG: Protein of unknown function DUF541 [Parcubacteria bacterium C7867-006]|nr:MAG: Protein of unknown function DUF541 [Parcubacteria bacterium C7867-006]
MNEFFDSTQKRRFTNALIVATILLATFLGAATLNAIKQNSYIGKGVYPSNVIAISGTGEVYAVPDIASFSFSVIEEGKTVKDAQDKATKKINSTIDAIKAFGIDEKDIKTTGYSSYPKYEYTGSACINGYCPPGRQILTGYEVSQSITVKVRKTDIAGDILTKVGELGASNISGLDFVVDDIESVKAQAREKAVADAKAKAKVLAKTLGVRLNKVVNFYESGDYPTPIYYAKDSMMGAGGVTMNASAPVSPSLPTGENKVVSNVTITYEVE